MSSNLPTLLIPGLNCSARLYSNQLPDIWHIGPVSIAYHLNGDTIEAIAAEILASAPPKFTLVGFSFGGYLAFEILRKAPNRVARLVLIDTSARPDTPEQVERRKQRIAAAQQGRFSDSLENQFTFVVDNTRRNDKALWDAYYSMAMECGADAFIRHMRASIAREDSRPLLISIRVPTLVIVGENDILTPLETSQEIANSIRNAQLAVLPKTGHLTPLEQPQLLSRTLIDFFSKTASSLY